ncbi:MAG: tRNA uridine-5-carboxymethylaminomethyl(34) synthesis GTPase MnmE [Spirochaetes bacterium]|nr:tRNA uridine-5-carboxymethylaminomethyl(34) synthesis GTPase MnmE [Spirochaetota bacterium]
MPAYTTEEAAAAIATPPGRGAIGVIRASGSDIVSRIAKVSSIRETLQNAAGYTVHYGAVVDPSTRTTLDEVLFLVFRTPRSYTGEDSVEIHCHGSPPGMRAIMDLLARFGVRQALPGEFTFRAFVNGKVDLTRAEAVNELVNSQTQAAQHLAIERLSGSVFSRIDAAKERLVRVMAGLAVQLDYPDEETDELPMEVATVREVRHDLERLRASYATGRLYQEGALVVIAGRTNAGKSSLFNALLREDRAIVSEVHGTTRDYLEVSVSMHGVPIRLIDTAGLRESQEDIENQGIRRSRELLEGADAVIYVVDATVGRTEEDEAELAQLDKLAEGAVVPVTSKIDLVSDGKGTANAGGVEVSAVTGRGIDSVSDAVVTAVRRRRGGQGYDAGSHDAPGAAIIDSARQRDLLDRTIGSLNAVEEAMDAMLPADAVAVDVQEAISSLGEITGEVTSADVLDVMFGSFCLGK